MKTIKQIADELGVSKTAVNKKIANLGLRSSLRKIANQFAIDEEQESLIKSAFLATESKTETATKAQTENPLFSILQAELEVKNRQISTLQEQNAQLTAALEHTTASLQAAQLLHAGTMQKQIEAPEQEPEKRSRWPFFKKRK